MSSPFDLFWKNGLSCWVGMRFSWDAGPLNTIKTHSLKMVLLMCWKREKFKILTTLPIDSGRIMSNSRSYFLVYTYSVSKNWSFVPTSKYLKSNINNKHLSTAIICSLSSWKPITLTWKLTKVSMWFLDPCIISLFLNPNHQATAPRRQPTVCFSESRFGWNGMGLAARSWSHTSEKAGVEAEEFLGQGKYIYILYMSYINENDAPEH